MKIGLSLKGMGADCFAMAGALQVFEDYGVDCSAYAGSGLNALILCMNLCGFSGDEMLRSLAGIQSELGSMTLMKKADFMISGPQKRRDRLEKQIHTILAKKKFTDLAHFKKIVFINAIDLNTAKLHIFTNRILQNNDLADFDHDAPISTAVRDSMGFCAMVLPKKYKTKILADMSIKCPSSAFLLKNCGYDKVIEICVRRKNNPPFHYDNVFSDAVNITSAELLKKTEIRSDYSVQLLLDNVDLHDKNCLNRCYEEGKLQTERVIADLMSKIYLYE